MLFTVTLHCTSGFYFPPLVFLNLRFLGAYTAQLAYAQILNDYTEPFLLLLAYCLPVVVHPNGNIDTKRQTVLIEDRETQLSYMWDKGCYCQ
jgi:hypothetical protein